MSRTNFAIAAGFSMALFLVAYEAQASENSCVNCHRELPRNTFVGSKYLDWKGSIHAKEKVACERCHGGNPNADQKGAAHTGVYNSGNPKSRVYYKNVPGSCGACHRRDFNAFKRSAHFAFLEQTGAGPTCVTCHESHTTRIIAPWQIPKVCTQCHNERMGIRPQVPTRAQALLLLINETSTLVRHAKEQIKEGDEERLQAWREAYAMMEKVRDEWHAFDLDEVQRTILNIYEMTARLLEKQG